ncbi:hypothetical protein C5S39_06320 [Candidatus Methanophagaceae archaeon]|nr:hypothetical protein C5S39_06320 [Methanophagales archaeon]
MNRACRIRQIDVPNGGGMRPKMNKVVILVIFIAFICVPCASATSVDADVLADEFAKLQKKVGISVIGVVVPSEEGICFKTGQGKEQIKIKGYQHF